MSEDSNIIPAKITMGQALLDIVTLADIETLLLSLVSIAKKMFAGKSFVHHQTYDDGKFAVNLAQ